MCEHLRLDCCHDARQRWTVHARTLDVARRLGGGCGSHNQCATRCRAVKPHSPALGGGCFAGGGMGGLTAKGDGASIARGPHHNSCTLRHTPRDVQVKLGAKSLHQRLLHCLHGTR